MLDKAHNHHTHKHTHTTHMYGVCMLGKAGHISMQL